MGDLRTEPTNIPDKIRCQVVDLLAAIPAGSLRLIDVRVNTRALAEVQEDGRVRGGESWTLSYEFAWEPPPAGDVSEPEPRSWRDRPALL